MHYLSIETVLAVLIRYDQLRSGDDRVRHWLTELGVQRLF